MSTSSVLIALVALIAMEPITAATHRWVMHGIGEFLHRSHHRRQTSRWETNDWYPVIFAAIVNLGFVAGFNVDGFAGLVPAGVGVTVYGLLYALVHDVYIHGRLGWFVGRRVAGLDRLADAHRIHHLYNAAPYGMLMPIVPERLREKSRQTARNPLARV